VQGSSPALTVRAVVREYAPIGEDDEKAVLLR